MSRPDGGPRRRSQARVLVEAVRISEVKAQAESILAAGFSVAEQEELRGRHVQTVAGFLALKRAYLAAAGELAPELGLSLTDVELSHEESGAPKVRRAPTLPARVFVSLAHSREHAYGIVAVEGEGDG